MIIGQPKELTFKYSYITMVIFKCIKYNCNTYPIRFQTKGMRNNLITYPQCTCITPR